MSYEEPLTADHFRGEGRYEFPALIRGELDDKVIAYGHAGPHRLAPVARQMFIDEFGEDYPIRHQLGRCYWARTVTWAEPGDDSFAIDWDAAWSKGDDGVFPITVIELPREWIRHTPRRASV